ncbi:hypothetical protein [Bacillus sp. NPDC094077]|uniref:hypothetical protein n=1 Tax=Bacillus sp. NPDC094077 TaxID=3390932 RepID=UPI003D05BAEF
MSLTLIFFLILFILFLSTYTGFLIWKRMTFGWEDLGFGALQYTILSRYLQAVRPPPQNSAGAKKLDGSRAARKRPIGVG